MNSESNALEWQVESLRLTAFVIGGVHDPKQADAWWNSTVGQQPEMDQHNRTNGLDQLAGKIFDGTCSLTLASQPGRVDWILSAAPSSELAGFPTMNCLEDVLHKFKALLDSWVAVSPKLNRMAFGAVLRMPVENKEQGYVRIASLLPAIKLDAKGSSEFSYSINRPRKLKSDTELTINRLSHWAVVQIRSIVLPVIGFVPQQSITPEIIACRLEIDISTDAERQVALETDKLPALFKELTEQTKEIATLGDIP